MGARLWSQRRSARSTHTPPTSHHAHTIITPTTFTHSDKVLAASTNQGRVASLRRHPHSRPAKCHRSQDGPGALQPMENWKDGLNVSAKSAGAKKKKSKNRKESWSSVEEPDDQDPNQLMHSPPTMPVSLSSGLACVLVHYPSNG
ncbi:uncharacterized protein [Procambarus clarkii]|uniref:uncharacterized protein n=1 Tax=Procambarus clarkii TaxID=6728 RepID=UPI003742BE84